MLSRLIEDLFALCIVDCRTAVIGRISCLCFAVSLLGAFEPASTQTADDPFTRGVRLEQKGDLEGARRAYEEALKAAPDRVDALSNLALVHLNLGRPGKAVVGLERARAAAPQNLTIPFFLGLAYFQTGRFPEAETELAGVVALQPGNTKARHLHGLCLLKLDQLNDGIATLEKVIAADVSNRSAAYTLGSAYIRVGRIDEADQLVKEVLSTDESPQARLIAGSVQLARKDYQGAVRTLRKAEQGNRKLPTLHSQLGVALLYVGHSGQAKKEFESELAISPDDYNANAFLGWLYQQDGNPDGAEKLLRRASELKQTDNGVRYLLAQVHQSRREWELAGKLLEQVVAAQPDFKPAHVMLARIYVKLKRPEDFRRERRIIKELTAKQQEKDLKGVDHLYDGGVLNLPRAREPSQGRRTK